MDNERFLEMTKKVNTNNAFVRLVLGKIEGHWCTRRGCTTCRGMKFREETLKDPEGLLKAIYELKREDVEHLDFVWEDCLSLALAYLDPWNPRRDEQPKIYKYADERYYEHSKWCYEMQNKIRDVQKGKDRGGKKKEHRERRGGEEGRGGKEKGKDPEVSGICKDQQGDQSPRYGKIQFASIAGRKARDDRGG